MKERNVRWQGRARDLVVWVLLACCYALTLYTNCWGAPVGSCGELGSNLADDFLFFLFSLVGGGLHASTSLHALRDVCHSDAEATQTRLGVAEGPKSKCLGRLPNIAAPIETRARQQHHTRRGPD
ncbi:unnamed protein product, partial [Laminaria digitata]